MSYCLPGPPGDIVRTCRRHVNDLMGRWVTLSVCPRQLNQPGSYAHVGPWLTPLVASSRKKTKQVKCLHYDAGTFCVWMRLSKCAFFSNNNTFSFFLKGRLFEVPKDTGQIKCIHSKYKYMHSHTQSHAWSDNTERTLLFFFFDYRGPAGLRDAPGAALPRENNRSGHTSPSASHLIINYCSPRLLENKLHILGTGLISPQLLIEKTLHLRDNSSFFVLSQPLLCIIWTPRIKQFTEVATIFCQAIIHGLI